MTLEDRAHELNQDIISAAMLVIGMIFALYGLKLFKYVIFFVGFVIGALGGWIIARDLIVTAEWEITSDGTFAISLTMGAILGLILVLLNKLAIFATGAMFGAISATVLWKIIVWIEPNPPAPRVIQFTLIIIFALICGFLALKFSKQVLRIATAFIGSFFVAASFGYFVQRIIGTTNAESTNTLDWVSFFAPSSTDINNATECDGFCVTCIFIWIIVFALGSFVQYKYYKYKHDKNENGNVSENENMNDRRDKRMNSVFSNSVASNMTNKEKENDRTNVTSVVVNNQNSPDINENNRLNTHQNELEEPTQTEEPTYTEVEMTDVGPCYANEGVY